MAVPSSGNEITLYGLKTELENNNYTATPAVGYNTETVMSELLSNNDINQNSSNKPSSNSWNASGEYQAGSEFKFSDFYSYDHDAAPSFTDTKAVGKSTSTGEANMIQIDSTGSSSIWNVTGTTAWTISFWVKAGWTSGLNTNIHFFHSGEENSTGTRNEQVRIYYREDNNRLAIERGNNNSNYHMQFWLFHANNTTAYETARAAAGLWDGTGSASASDYWSATNRGNTGDDDFTMLTFTMSGTNSAAPAHLKAYWNASHLGDGFYASGYTKGSPSMSASTSREVAIGMNTANNLKSGDNSGVATLYNDLTIWNKELSASEITELFNSGTRMDATTHSAASNLKGYYTFEDSNGNDSSGQSAGNFSINGDSAIATI